MGKYLDLVDTGPYLRGTSTGGRVPVKAWTKGVEFDENAQAQIANLTRMPFVFNHIAVLSDVHWGKGASVGTVIATKGAVIPAAVGVDIGCGMIAQRTTLKADQLPDNLGPLRAAIEKAVPHGRTNNGGPGDRGAWGPSATSTKGFTMLEAILTKHPKLTSVPRGLQQAGSHLGTLGTGNHFIEVCVDTEGYVWVMLHSGSRGIGNRIGSYFIDQAKEQADKFFYAHTLVDSDLSYLVEGTPIFNDYVEAVGWAQDYAFANRQLMMDATLNALGQWSTFDLTDSAVNCHHNYVTRERHFGQNVLVTRKGAVRAQDGDLGIIPGSMGVQSFIVRGKGNRESFNSCSHGAGRKLGRNEAKRQITMDDFNQQVEGVECRHDPDVIDEAPGAYKSIEAVMAAQNDLVEIVHTLKQVLCVKG